MRKLTSLCLAFTIVGLLAGSSSAEVLYDASLLTTPFAQGWGQLFFPSQGTVTAPSAGNLYTTLDTTGINTISVVRNSPSFAIGAGSTFNFDLQLNSEAHVIDNRAGLSVVVIGDDPTKSLELDFWTDTIYAQETGFTKAESVSFDMLAGGTGLGGTHSFTLKFSSASTYSLFANGGADPILTGNLRDYTGFGFPYDQPDNIFVGDNSSRGNSSFKFARFEANAAAPEPGAGLLLTIGILLPVALYVRRNTRRPVKQTI